MYGLEVYTVASDAEVQHLVPTAVAALAGEAAVEVAVGYVHTVVRLAGGGLRAFGDNSLGQLGGAEAASTSAAAELPPTEAAA